MTRKNTVRDRVETDSKTSKAVKQYPDKEHGEVDVNNNVNVDVNNDNDDYDATGSDVDVINSTSNDIDDVNDNSVNGVVIEVVSNKIQPKRATYYLKPDTIKQINKISKNSGLGKS